MSKNYYKDKIVMYFSFFITLVIYIVLLIINNIEYKEGIKLEEKMVGKKLYSDVSIRANIMEERMKHEIDRLKFMKDGIVELYSENKETQKIKLEMLLNRGLESEKGFVSAYVLFKEDKKEIAVYKDEKAFNMAEVIYKESNRKKSEVYISEFNLSTKIQYIGMAIKINEESRLVAIYNFKYLIENFIENGGSGNYINYFILDQYGNIVFEYERERIGENIFVINASNEAIKKQIKNYIEKDSGIEKTDIEQTTKEYEIIGKVTAWKSFEIENKKIIAGASASYKELEKIKLKLKEQKKYTDIIITALFIAVLITIYNIFRRGGECKINNRIKDEKDNLEFVINESKSIFWEFYPKEKKIYFSENFYEITGHSRESFKNDIDTLRKIVPETDFKNVKKVIDDAKISETGEINFESRIKKRTDKYIWFLSRGKIIRDENRDIIKMIGFLTDITEIKQKESELISFKTAVEQSPVTIVFTDTEGKITYVNQKFTALTGYTKEEALGENPKILKSERHDNEFYRNMWDTLIAGAVWSGEMINRKKNGELYYEKANIAPIIDEMKRTVAYIAIKEDVTRQKEVDIKMERFATRDELTGVFNRRAGLEFLEQEIKIANRNLEKFSVIYVDVNNLKYVNDNMGHSYGDSLIVEVCGGIKEEIRSSDIITRLGGDEFMVVMPNCDRKEADIIWRRVIKSFEYLNNNFNRKYKVSASHGIYEYTSGSNATVDMILEAADREMYIEKKRIKAEKSEEKNV